MIERAPRLGDVIDDYCPTCRLLMNHDVASLKDNAIAKVTCRTCHNTHDYRHAQVPVKRKSKSKKDDTQSLVAQVLAGMTAPPPPPPPPAPEVPTVRKRRDLWAEVRKLQEKQGK